MNVKDLMVPLYNKDILKAQDYIEQNAKEKLSKCQPLDIIILKVILNDAINNDCITKEGLINPKYSQSMSYSAIIKNLGNNINGDVDQVCQISIIDLCNYGFIVQTQLNHAQEMAYGMTPLGISALKIACGLQASH